MLIIASANVVYFHSLGALASPCCPLSRLADRGFVGKGSLTMPGCMAEICKLSPGRCPAKRGVAVGKATKAPDDIAMPDRAVGVLRKEAPPFLGRAHSRFIVGSYV